MRCAVEALPPMPGERLSLFLGAAFLRGPELFSFRQCAPDFFCQRRKLSRHPFKRIHPRVERFKRIFNRYALFKGKHARV